jgi:hypothetical protein
MDPLDTILRLARELEISPAQLLILAREAARDSCLLSVYDLNREGQILLIGELRMLEAMAVRA